jgi:hypothetical protein
MHPVIQIDGAIGIELPTHFHVVIQNGLRHERRAVDAHWRTVGALADAGFHLRLMCSAIELPVAQQSGGDDAGDGRRSR